MVMFDEVSQRLAFLEGDHGQQAIAGERQMESAVRFAMAVAVAAYQPAYSPDRKPIELAVAKLKAALRGLPRADGTS